MNRAQLMYGGVPVPYAVSWTGENEIYVGKCPHAHRTALCEKEARGEGKPRFGKPHMNRQREVVINDWCDLCAKPLKGRTKVSLSHARPQIHGAKIGDILQFEPLLHKECALESMRHCPSLKRDILNGTLVIRQVYRHAVQLAVYSELGVFEATGVRTKALSHAKVQLIKWADRDLNWLEQAHV